MTAHKAWVAALVGFCGPILSYLYTWLNGTDSWAWRPFWAFLIGSVITALTAYGFTWKVSNTPKTYAEHSPQAVALDNSHSQNMEG